MGLRLFGGHSECQGSYKTSDKCTYEIDRRIQQAYERGVAAGKKDSGSLSKNYGNPNPKNFEIIQSYAPGNDSCALKIKYPDSTNYEGIKILVYEYPIHEVLAQPSLDPHFCDHEDCISPFARYEPSELGWALAKELADKLSGIKNRWDKNRNNGKLL